jgi:hypothetical protein
MRFQGRSSSSARRCAQILHHVRDHVIPVPMRSSKDDDQGFVLGQVDKQPEHIAPAAIVIGIKRHRRPASELLQEFDSVLVRGSVCGEE